jgi:hypothetical protein
MPAATISASPGNSVCEGTSVTYTVTPTANAGSTPTYRWLKGGTPISPPATGSTYSYVPANGDVISCEMTSSIACPSQNPVTTGSITMAITAVVIPSVTITGAPD